MSTTTANPFSKKASNSSGEDFERPPSGAHPAYLIGLIDLGTQPYIFNKEQKEAPKIMFVWELTAEKNKAGDSFVVGQDFTFSLAKNSHLRPFAEGWIGKSLGADEEVDFLSLVGQPCQITLTDGTTASGKKFVEVASVCKPMRGLTVPEMTITPYVYTFESRKEPDLPGWVPFSYGKKVLDVMKLAKEWNDIIPF